MFKVWPHKTSLAPPIFLLKYVHEPSQVTFAFLRFKKCIKYSAFHMTQLFCIEDSPVYIIPQLTRAKDTSRPSIYKQKITINKTNNRLACMKVLRTIYTMFNMHWQYPVSYLSKFTWLKGSLYHIYHGYNALTIFCILSIKIHKTKRFSVPYIPWLTCIDNILYHIYQNSHD